MQYKVHSIWPANPPTWTNDYGTFNAYEMNLVGQDGSRVGNVGLNKKAGNQPPAEGSVIEGEINQTNNGPKFKMAQSSSGGGGGGGQRSGGGSSGGGGGGFPPHVQASIVYQHAQKCAVDAVNAMPGGIPADVAGYAAKVREVAGELSKDVQRVWESHGGPPAFGAPAPAGGAHTPPAAPQADGGDFGQPPAQGGFDAAPGGGGFGAAPADSDIPFAYRVDPMGQAHNYNPFTTPEEG